MEQYTVKIEVVLSAHSAQDAAEQMQGLILDGTLTTYKVKRELN